ncbi:NAD(P)H-binding protein [Microlunatus sp. GCM10028923]|uniref:NAD(P)H-binding protein n=1 Tax=Microlunatus sp. GCM10028923 TaxID=3273400 RepID=UPI003610BE73
MIIITTPTGQIGRQVLQRVVDHEPVRVIARDPGKLPAELRDRVEVITGSHGDRATVQHAFEGADAVFWLIPPNPRADSLQAAYADFTRPAVEALRDHGVPRVVGVSALGRGTAVAGRAGLVTATLAADDLFGAGGTGYRALALPSFMDNVARQAASIRDRGVFTGPLPGDRRDPACATRDIADAAARLLLDRTWDGVAEVPVLGPEDLSADEQAMIISDVLGRPVRYQQVSDDAYREVMIKSGWTPAMADGMVEMAQAKRTGLDRGVVRTPETSSPTTFRQWCEEVLKPAVLIQAG